MTNLMLHVYPCGEGGVRIEFSEATSFAELTQQGKEDLIVLLQSIPSVRPDSVAAQTETLATRPGLGEQLDGPFKLLTGENELAAQLCERVYHRFVQAGMNSFQGRAQRTSELDIDYILWAHHLGATGGIETLSKVVEEKVQELIREAKDDGYDTVIWRLKPQYNDGKFRMRYHFTTLGEWRKVVAA